MARFRCRAPYFRSVPSFNKKSRASSVVLKTNDFSGEVLKIRCWTMFNSMSRIFLQLVGAERLERDDLIETIDELGRELAPRGVRAAAHDLSVELLVHGSVLGLPGAFTAR